MKSIFNTTNSLGVRVLAYDKLDMSLIDRHLEWVKSKSPEDKDIYMIFFLQEESDKKEWKSNALTNQFCQVYLLDRERSKEWILNFCNTCFTEEDPEGPRQEYCLKMLRRGR